MPKRYINLSVFLLKVYVLIQLIVYVFGARETTAPPGYGTAGGLVNQVLAAYPGSASAAIVYPACGGQASCGGASYDSSASQGTAAVVSAVTSYNKQCPNTQIVLIGYSQVCGPLLAARTNLHPQTEDA